ncbi:MAG: rod shape-determining protein MreD [Candidatus Omnitrophota bacterium]
MFIRNSLNQRSFLVVVLVNFGIQYLAFRYLRIFGIAPNLTLLLVLFLSLSFPGTIGLISALALGLYQDILFNSTIGGHSIVYLLVAYIASRFLAEKTEFNTSTTLLYSVYFSFFFSVVYQTICAPAWGITLLWKPIAFSIYNSLWSLPAFYLYQRELV